MESLWCEWMELCLRLKIRGVGAFWSAIASYVVPFAIHSDRGNPRIDSMSLDSWKSVFVVILGTDYVLIILGTCCQSQIGKSVIKTVPVDVINFIDRPHSCHVKPCQSVRSILASAKSDVPISRWIKASCCIPDISFAVTLDNPSKNTCIWIVMQQFFQSLLGKARMLVSHDALLSLSGERRQIAEHGLALRYCSTGGI